MYIFYFVFLCEASSLLATLLSGLQELSYMNELVYLSSVGQYMYCGLHLEMISSMYLLYLLFTQLLLCGT